jgi:hypothetical protein
MRSSAAGSAGRSSGWWAIKPRTSPYAFQGLGEAGLKILAEVRAETGLPIVTEVVDAVDVDLDLNRMSFSFRKRRVSRRTARASFCIYKRL